MLARWLQIRVGDRVVVWQFYKSSEDTEPFGSRGKNYDENTFKEFMSLTFSELYEAKVKGVEIKDLPETLLEKMAKSAYDEYLEAKKIEEERKRKVIEV